MWGGLEIRHWATDQLTKSYSSWSAASVDRKMDTCDWKGKSNNNGMMIASVVIILDRQIHLGMFYFQFSQLRLKEH